MLVQTCLTWCREAAGRASGKWSILAGPGALPAALRAAARSALFGGLGQSSGQVAALGLGARTTNENAHMDNVLCLGWTLIP
jgi:hypothetical protein